MFRETKAEGEAAEAVSVPLDTYQGQLCHIYASIVHQWRADAARRVLETGLAYDASL